MAVSIDRDSKILGVLDLIKEAGSGVHQNPWDNIRDKVGGLLYNTLVEPQEYQTPVFDTGQTKQFADTHNAMLPEQGSKQSMLLPFGYDAQGNIEPAIPSLVRDVGLGAFGLLGEYEKAQTGTGYQDVRDITGQEAANVSQGMLEVMTGGLLDNAPKTFTSGLRRIGDKDANFKNWFGDSKVVGEDGKPLTVYHGTDRGGFNSFDPYEVGSNTSNSTHGFYFSDDYGTAKTYSRGQYTIEPHSLNKEDFFKNPSEFDVDLEDHGDYWTATNHEGYVYEGDTKEEVLNELLNTGGLEDVSGVYEVNLSIKDPLEVDFEGRSWDGLNKYGEYDGFEGMPEWEQIAKDGGYDGVIASNVSDEGSYGRGYQGSDGKTYITFKPTQIKSIHNRGTYDPKDPNILNAGGKGVGLLNAGSKVAKGLLDSTPTGVEKRVPVTREDVGLLQRVGDVDPVNDLKVEYEATNLEFPEQKVLKAEDLIDRPYMSGMADTSRGGMETVRSINGIPTNTMMWGGQLYVQNPITGVWANAGTAATGIRNAAQEASEIAGTRGKPLMLPHQMGSVGSMDFNTAIPVLQVQYSRQVMSPSAKKAFDDRIRKGIVNEKGNWQANSEPLKDWVGIDHPNVIDYMNKLGGQRKVVIKALDDFRDEGALSASQARSIIVEPRQQNPKLGNLFEVGNINLDDPVKGSHPTFPMDVLGDYEGTFKTVPNIHKLNPYNRQGLLFLDDMAQRRKPDGSLRYDLSKETQPSNYNKALNAGVIGKLGQKEIDYLLSIGAIEN
jgi:hypothetical protein